MNLRSRNRDLKTLEVKDKLRFRHIVFEVSADPQVKSFSKQLDREERTGDWERAKIWI